MYGNFNILAKHIIRCIDIPVLNAVLFYYLRSKLIIFSEKRKFIYSMTTQIALVYHLFQYFLNRMREKILIINHDDYILPRWMKVWRDTINPDLLFIPNQQSFQFLRRNSSVIFNMIFSIISCDEMSVIPFVQNPHLCIS